MKMEHYEQDARKLLNCFVKAQKLMNKQYTTMNQIDVYPVGLSNYIQVNHLIVWCDLMDISYKREDWEGNKACDSTWDIVYFEYKNCVFYELVKKEKDS